MASEMNRKIQCIATDRNAFSLDSYNEIKGGVFCMEKTVLCIKNGDLRQECLAEILKEKGYQTGLCEDIQEEILEQYDCLLFPIVMTEIDLEKIEPKLKKGQCIFGGTFPEEFQKKCKQKEVHCYEYMKEESIAIKNAVATAEGAIAEALRIGRTNLSESYSLVLGYGKCGRILADRLRGMQSKVSIYERDVLSAATANTYGFEVINDLQNLEKYRYLFSTIPQKLLCETELRKIEKDAVLIDIATGGGLDYEYCKKHHINAKLCPGLPGKYAPVSSAEILAEYVMKKGK